MLHRLTLLTILFIGLFGTLGKLEYLKPLLEDRYLDGRFLFHRVPFQDPGTKNERNETTTSHPLKGYLVVVYLSNY